MDELKIPLKPKIESAALRTFCAWLERQKKICVFKVWIRFDFNKIFLLVLQFFFIFILCFGLLDKLMLCGVFKLGRNIQN